MQCALRVNKLFTFFLRPLSLEDSEKFRTKNSEFPPLRFFLPSFTGNSLPHRMACEGSANYGFLLCKGVRQSYDRSGSGPLYHKYEADIAATPEFPNCALDGEPSAIDSNVYSVPGGNRFGAPSRHRSADSCRGGSGHRSYGKEPGSDDLPAVSRRGGCGADTLRNVAQYCEHWESDAEALLDLCPAPASKGDDSSDEGRRTAG